MKQSLLFTLQVAGRVAYMVVLPIFLFGGAGLLLDRSIGTLPLFLLGGIGLSLVVTVFWMSRQLKKIVQSSVEEMNKE